MTFKVRKAMAVMDSHRLDSNFGIFDRRGNPWISPREQAGLVERRDNPDLDQYFTKRARPDGKGSLYAPVKPTTNSRSVPEVRLVNALNKARATLRAVKVKP